MSLRNMYRILGILVILVIGVFINESGKVSAPEAKIENDASVVVSNTEALPETEPEVKVETTSEPELVSLPEFTTETLAKYNGTNPDLPIYIAFEGSVYDVTPGKAYYEKGGSYDFLSGTDGTPLLKMIGGDIIKRKYKVIGTFTP